MNKINKLNIFTFLVMFLILTSCELDQGDSLNGASTSSISEDLSRGELPQAIAGVLSDMRVGLNTQVDVQSVFGREYYYFTSSDPRFEGDVVNGNLDNNTFYTTTPWGARYAAIKDINLILEGLNNTTSDFSTEEIAATRGVLNTLKAHELLMISNNQYTNGMRIDVSDPENLGSFVTYEQALTEISNLLSTAYSDLVSAGSVPFPFGLTSGFQVNFLEFNKALNARVETYRGNYTNVLDLLDDSFLDLNGNLNLGVYHLFSLSGADQSNPLFIAQNETANVRVAHSSFLNDAALGDSRRSKVSLRDKVRSTTTGLSGSHDVWIYQSNVDAVPIIKNEELILLYAEANALTNPTQSVNAINTIRNAAGIGNYNGGTSENELINEILYQRRYSLFGEGHRWVDMRRFDRLDQLPNDRTDDNVPNAVPVPANENQ